MRRRFGLAAILALTLMAGPAWAAPPAGDQYLPDFPDAKGKKEAADSEPKADRGLLPAQARRELGRSPEDDLLAVIATSEALGSPSAADRFEQDGSGGTSEGVADPPDESALTAVANGVASPAGLLIAIAIVIVAVLALRARRRPGRSSG